RRDLSAPIRELRPPARMQISQAANTDGIGARNFDSFKEEQRRPPGRSIPRRQPPAIAPTTKNGSAPLTTSSGNGVSGGSRDKSSLQAKNLMNGRRFNVP